MAEIKEILIPEINAVTELPQVALPDAPPVTLNIGVPVIELPHFDTMDFEPEIQAPKPAASKSKPAKPVQPEVPKIKLPQPAKPIVAVEEEKPLLEQVVEALPTIPQATTVTVSSVIGVSAGLATPFLLKLIKPAVKKAAKKLQKALGRQPVPEGVSARRALQRSLRG